MRYKIIAVLLLLTSFMASAENAELRSYSLQKHGTFELKVPASWKDDVSQPPGVLPPTITLSPKVGPQFQILVTPIWPARPDIKFPTQDELRTDVSHASNSALEHSVEKTIEIKELKGTGNFGYYFAATDRAPAPGEFKYLNQGVIAVKDLRVTFTILTNDGQDAIIKQALSLLLSAKRQ